MTSPVVHGVSLRFRDGVEHSIRVAAGQTVLDAALEQGAPILFQCRSGSCSSCIANLTDGPAEMRKGGASVLLKSEADAGKRLLCQTHVAGDCGFDLDYDSTAGSNGPRKLRTFVDSVERIADDAVRLKLELASGDWFDFLPGQFIQVCVPGTDIWRSYSIASTPAELPSLELLIRLLPGGAMSEWLVSNAKPEDIVAIEAPFGNFFLREKVRAPHIMIAGGTGLAPMMAMIDTIRVQSGKKPPILLSFGCAGEAGLFNREQLELRSLWMPGLDIRISVDRGPAGRGVHIGNPVQAVTAADIRDPYTVAYLCGPPGLIAAARMHLAAIGVAPENIHAEQFVASS
jgi:benzoate/toluate 1,2-dioxygenase reductase subunit